MKNYLGHDNTSSQKLPQERIGGINAREAFL